MSWLLEKLKGWNRLYAFYREIQVLIENRKKLWANAVYSFEKYKPEHGNLRDYKKAMQRHRISYDEYNTYNYWCLDKKERSNYLSDFELKCIYRKLCDSNEIKWLDNKLLLHEKFQTHMQRKWLCPSIVSFDTFHQFLSTTNCIIKPWKGSLGKGVFEVQNEQDEKSTRELYDRCRNEGLFVEEKVRSCKTMEEFHPKSLNTIRVMTMSNGKRTEILGGVFRMGVGDHVVDNGAAGGILAPIDLKTGFIIDNGRDEKGHVFVTHPDTGKMIKGFAIPYWNEVVSACKKMSTYIPEVIFAGWDIGVTENGAIELIEVNSGPHIKVLQTAYGYGFRPKIKALGKELFGYDLMKLIPVWAKPHVSYKTNMWYKKHLRDVDQTLKDYVETSLKTTKK